MTGDAAHILGVTESVSGRAWVPRLTDERLAMTLAQRLGISDLLSRVIAGRGVDLDAASHYLDPSLRDLLPNPSQLADMDKAAQRIVAALQNNEEIAIFGDYDVDGATSSATLSRFFTSLGIETRIYIPDRTTEGYGPNAAAFDHLKREGVTLVITVDCGTLAFDPLTHANKIGLDVIVVDHHQAEAHLPDAVAIVNPNRLDDQSGYGYLAAVGVAYLLVIAVNRALRESGWYQAHNTFEPNLLTVLDLVALGTVCDVVPLKGVNRAFVSQGLKVMQMRQNTGLNALADIAKVETTPGTYELGFQLGPRVNAGGRVGKSDLGSRLLTTEDPVLATDLAIELDRLNQERKAIEVQVQSDALAVVEQSYAGGALPPLLLVTGKQWHAGVIGIVASRIKDKYRRPSFVIAIDQDGVGKGSGRSIPGVDLGNAVVAAQNAGLLISGGGHAMAAGLTVAEDRLEDLQAFLNDHLAKQVAQAGASFDLKLDGVLSVTGANEALVHEMAQAGPYGAANPEPQFVLANVRIVHADVVGGSHVRCVIAGDDGGRLKAIAFRCADQPLGEALLGRKGEFLHIAGKIRHDTWAGNGAVQMLIEDVALPRRGQNP